MTAARFLRGGAGALIVIAAVLIYRGLEPFSGMSDQSLVAHAQGRATVVFAASPSSAGTARLSRR